MRFVALELWSFGALWHPAKNMYLVVKNPQPVKAEIKE